MTNVDPTHLSNNPIGEFAEAARKIEALKPEIIAALGRNAAQQIQESSKKLVSEASGLLVSALTEIAEGLTESPNEPVTVIPEGEQEDKSTAQKQTIHPGLVPRRQVGRRTRVVGLPAVQKDISLSYEELEERVDLYLSATPGGDVHLPVVIRAILGESRIDGQGYRYVQDILQKDIGVDQIGMKRYRLLPSRERNALRSFPQLELWDDEVPLEAPRLLTIKSDVEETEVEAAVPVEEADTISPALIEEENAGEVEIISDEELIGIISRFMGRRPYFTGAELRDHLLANEAVTPEEVSGNKIHHFIREMMVYVDEYYFDRGDEVIWLDSKSDPRGVRAAMGGKDPRVLTYVLGFIPRETPAAIPVPPAKRVKAPVQPKVVEQEAVAAAPETRGQHERGITQEQIDGVVQLVSELGGAVTRKSLIEIMTDPDESDLTKDDVEELLDAAMAAGSLYRRSIRGSGGVSIDPKTKKAVASQSPEDRHDTEYIEREVEKYARVVDYVMNSLTGLKELTMGLRYDRLWRRAGMDEDMTFDEFKDLVRRMEDDGLVAIPTNAKLSSGKSRSQAIRGSKVMFPDPEVRRQWKTYRGRMLNEARDKALNRLIK